ncbi:MAG: thiamine phosphate synthase [Inquilinaceae bacterium]
MSGPAPPCRLYLRTPGVFDPATFAPMLTTALDAGDVACLEIALDTVDQTAWRAAVDALRPLAQTRNVAVLLRGSAELAAATGCDGVRADPGADVNRLRGIVGANASIGVLAGGSRHEAMVAAERGADFVGLAADPGLIAWWAELMEVPCVAFTAADIAAAGALARAGADFVAVDDAVWTHPDGPAAAVEVLITALATIE